MRTGIVKVGPTKAGASRQYEFHKLYLSPLTDGQVNRFIRKRFPFWKRKQRVRARQIVDAIPDLAVRPMLLTHVPDLVSSAGVAEHIDNAAQLYEHMVEAWLMREEGILGVAKEPLRKFSERLAVDLYVNREARGAERISADEAHQLAQEWGIDLDRWALTGRSLLNRDAEGHLKFAHRSIMEFLVVYSWLSGRYDSPRDGWTDQMNVFLSQWIGTPEFRADAWYLPRQANLGFVHIPAGPFSMGEDEGSHEVTLPEFYIARYATTVAQFTPFAKGWDGWKHGVVPSRWAGRKEVVGRPDHPVTGVSLHEALAYCSWLTVQLRAWDGTPEPLASLLRDSGWSATLPSEEEWEKAARGTDGRIYPWGNDAPTPDRANYRETGLGTTSPVGMYSVGASPYSVVDMAGNVFELTGSRVHEGKVVLRGGSFDGVPLVLRAAYRLNIHPVYRYNLIGFRVVWSAAGGQG